MKTEKNIEIKVKKKLKETKWETKVISNIRQSKKHFKNVDDKESKYIHVFYRYI